MHKTITDWARTSPLREVKMLHSKAPTKGTRGRYLRRGPYKTNKVVFTVWKKHKRTHSFHILQNNDTEDLCQNSVIKISTAPHFSTFQNHLTWKCVLWKWLGCHKQGLVTSGVKNMISSSPAASETKIFSFLELL